MQGEVGSNENGDGKTQTGPIPNMSRTLDFIPEAMQGISSELSFGKIIPASCNRSSWQEKSQSLERGVGEKQAEQKKGR